MAQSKNLEEAKSRIRLITENLPKAVKYRDVSPIAITPGNTLTYRELLIWRAEELSRNACVLYEQGELGAAIILTRSFVETVAATWYLMRLIKGGYSPNFDKKIVDLLMGHKIKDKQRPKHIPDAINVLTFLDAADKDCPGIKSLYEQLSEYAHPNWAGTSYLYSDRDQKEYKVTFGKFKRSEKNILKIGISCLLGSLVLFEHCYNKIGDLLPKFIESCEEHTQKSKAKK